MAGSGYPGKRQWLGGNVRGASTETDVAMLTRTNPQVCRGSRAGCDSCSPVQATRLPLQRARYLREGDLSTSERYEGGFTLAELLVTVGVLVLLVLLFTQLLNSAATITTLGHKQMDADSQARQLLDRMAIDFAQMVKRNDVDFFAKGTVAPNSVGGTMAGNDRIAFYSAVPGYYPSTEFAKPSLARCLSSKFATPMSSSYNKMERLGKGLLWNGVSTTDTPVVFLPLTICSNLAGCDEQYQHLTPPTKSLDHRFSGLNIAICSQMVLFRSRRQPISPRIAAIVVDIAVIDPKSKVLLTDAQITTLAREQLDLITLPAWLRASCVRTGRPRLTRITTLPRPALSGIRLYERYFYLSP